MSAARPPEGAHDPAHGRPKPGRVQLPTDALLPRRGCAPATKWPRLGEVTL
jgi:hypothetical protein